MESAFQRLLGREPSEGERQRLYRLREVLGLRDNDAFWAIVMALEHYDAWFRQYPEKLAEETRRTIEHARATFAAAAQSEAASVERALSHKVAETSVEIARKLAERPVGLHRVTLVLSAVVGFGALSVNAGYHLAGEGRPFWAESAGSLSGAPRMLSSLLRVPAGWMIFALLLPAFVHGSREGWALAREASGEGRSGIVGWLLVALCVIGCVVLLVLLAKLT